MRFKVTYIDEFEGKNEDEIYEQLLQYLTSVVEYHDLTAFGLKKLDKK